MAATIEIKGASGTLNSIVQRIRDGRWQSRRVMVDVRGTGTEPAAAAAAIRTGLIRCQHDLDEVIVVSDDLSIDGTVAEETIAFPDLSLIEQVEALLPTLALPRDVEYRVEPAFDYPGQQVAIDLAATTDDSLTTAVETVRDALFVRFRIATRTCTELDREIRAKQTA